ncbi:IQ domain-containing protein K-like [Cylas formicarius]|uniref:IQ domain-containing protein K-like n=1 Tax=Cylas formicarius TaxID=197179 RepID=UPI0029583339|nr:IQ domain-containing protein K-like [Cylas formicarius]
MQKTNQQDFCWPEAAQEFQDNRREIEEYLRRKREGDGVTISSHPEVAYLNNTVFPVLNQGLIELLVRVTNEGSCYRPKSTFNGLDFLAEYLYNLNPRHPNRRHAWTYIFDIDWVKRHLEKCPRPYYPPHLVWDTSKAALKIQAYMRGYWVRRRPEVLELRTFWKQIKLNDRSD